jgi:dihydroflavonol-4-reductase
MEQSAKSDGTVLVTGGSGFVGGWCIVELLRRGYDVRTTIRDSSRETEVRDAVSNDVDPEDRLSFFEADLLEDGGWDAAVAGCDYVLHVASPFPATARFACCVRPCGPACPAS